MNKRAKVKTGPFETSIDLWHPIEGKWVHIVQIYDGDEIRYYTDGELVEPCPDQLAEAAGEIATMSSEEAFGKIAGDHTPGIKPKKASK